MEDPRPLPTPTTPHRGMNPTTAALLGTALGIVGSLFTTSIATKATLTEHWQDRADARARDRREMLSKTYLATITALRVCEEEARRFNLSSDPPIDFAKEERKSRVSDDVLSPLRLLGGADPVYAFDEAMKKFDILRGTTNPHTTQRSDATVVFYHSCSRFTETARADIQGDIRVDRL